MVLKGMISPLQKTSAIAVVKDVFGVLNVGTVLSGFMLFVLILMMRRF